MTSGPAYRLLFPTLIGGAHPSRVGQRSLAWVTRQNQHGTSVLPQQCGNPLVKFSVTGLGKGTVNLEGDLATAVEQKQVGVVRFPVVYEFFKSDSPCSTGTK
jgi:hypothetical protein